MTIEATSPYCDPSDPLVPVADNAASQQLLEREPAAGTSSHTKNRWAWKASGAAFATFMAPILIAISVKYTAVVSPPLTPAGPGQSTASPAAAQAATVSARPAEHPGAAGGSQQRVEPVASQRQPTVHGASPAINAELPTEEQCLARIKQLGGRSKDKNGRLIDKGPVFRIELTGTKATDDDVRDLCCLRDLECLELSGTRISGTGLLPLAGLSKLSYLGFHNAQLNDEDVQHLNALVQLRSLHLGPSRQMSTVGLEQLRLPNLQDLCIVGMPVTNAALGDLVTSHLRLRTLFLSGSRLTDDGLAHVARLSGLRSFSLSSGSVSDAGLRHLSQVTSLESLKITGNNRITDAGLRYLAGLDHLRELSLASKEITARGMVELKPLAALKTLVLSDADITDATATHMLDLSQLRHLTLQRTSLSDAGFEVIEAGLPDAVVAGWDQTAAAAEMKKLGGQIYFDGDKNATYLTLARTKVTDSDLNHLQPLRTISHLDLSGTSITDAGLRHVADLPQLSTLKLAGTKIDDASLAHVAKLSKLRLLNLDGTAVTDAGLAHLRGLKQLATLEVLNTKVTEAGVSELRKSSKARVALKRSKFVEAGPIGLSNASKTPAALKGSSALRTRQRDELHAALVGKPAFALDGAVWLNGSPLAPVDLQGKVVLLDFWAVWCGPCIATFPHLRHWHERFQSRGLVVVGVTRAYQYGWDPKSPRAFHQEGITLAEEHAALSEFARHHQLKYRLAVMPDDDLSKKYGVMGIPQLVVIDRAGKIAAIRVGAGAATAEAIEDLLTKLLEPGRSSSTATNAPEPEATSSVRHDR